ncbi:cyclic nucleotide-gated olfactory channel-like [Daphnia carinata]|uniref:cyclic nucleotide-gated olfactory channel-like n=1 Tax=Daphnia carinata TaxID=120202 RepID=UPI00257C18C3|nr:cyclic nucleotide-gated olfactory channel-like [Daphnia carinata]
MSSTSSMSASAGGGNRRRGVFSLGRYHLPVVGSANVQQQHLIDSSNSGGGVRAVKYTPRGHPLQQQADTSLLHGYSHANSRDNGQQDDELEEIAVVSVSGVQSGQLTYGSAGSSMANGPRVVPGIITSARLMEDRLSGSGTRINTVASSNSGLFTAGGSSVGSSSATGATGGSSFVGGPPSLSRNRSFSKHSLLEIVSNRISGSGVVGTSSAESSGGIGLTKRFSRESFSAACVNKTQQPQQQQLLQANDSLSPSAATELLASSTTRRSRDARRRDLKNKLKLERNWDARQLELGGNGAHNFASSGANGGGASSGPRSGCKWTFVFDPAGRLCYYWSMVVSLAFLYNFWVLIYRFAFQEIASDTLVMWLCLDYFCDLVYVLDIAFHFRTGYLEEGVLQTDASKLRQHYMNSTTFYVDCLCLLPLDFLYLSIGFNSMLRCFRLVKIYRFWTFMDRTERHTNYPNVFRSISLVHYLLVIFHWNACLYRIVMRNNSFDQSLIREWQWTTPPDPNDGVGQYLQSFYLCTLTLTTTGGVLKPRTKGELLFVIIQLIFGLMLFATVLGHVSNIVINVSAARKEFQAKLDAVKTYMRMRRVPRHLQVKVIKWFDYLWFTQKSSDEEKSVGGLPDKLKAEIAIHVHLDTLKRVEIFQNTEAGFLCELVLRLRPVLFSPGDYICRKGEVGKEMYIVNRGRLQVVADNGRTVLATLKAGSYFGEISILNMGTAGNRRTASVRSVGYSDLFVLSKKDMWDVLKEYPAARVRLEAIAVKRLEKYKKAPLEKAALGRSHSTPGLVESSGRIPLERMELTNTHPLHLPSNPESANIVRSSAGSSSSTGTGGESRCSFRTSRRSSALQQQQPLLTPQFFGDPSAGSLLMPPAFLASGGVGNRSTSPGTSRDLVVLEPPILKTLPPADALVAEINRLRERLLMLESENTSLSAKLNRQQWEVENRLAEIEMQICGAGSPADSATDDNERNFESAI